ncbi:MAG TPA: phosphoribosylglycinamide formyltransferase [Actinomycetota bacterium]|nr:phosphoribosylglycinamide formyltransferase [Actinomycetota bacterium]
MDRRIAVLASGRGSNLQAFLDHPATGPLVTVVISDRPDAEALGRARAAGVPAVHLDPAPFPDRGAHDAALVSLLGRHDVDLVCLAGYMRILTPAAVRPLWGRMVNVHPSLLPAFPGARAIRDALAWGVKVTGVTVHLVDEEVDHGPILAQEAVPVREDDDEASLRARIQEVEHRLYPATVVDLAEGRLRVRGRRVVREEPVRP